MTVVSTLFGFFDLFSTFQFYDDEGHMMMFARLFTEGHVMYDEVFTPYGPFYLFFKWLLHDFLAIPITNDAIRLITLTHWLLLAGTCAWIVFRATLSYWWALLAYGIVFYSLDAFHNEPGHTQELAASLAALIPLIVANKNRRTQTWGWFLAGVVGGFVFMSKANIGLFCLAATGVALVGDLHRAKVTNFFNACLLLGSVVFPFALMWPLLSEPGFLLFAMLASCTLGGAALAVVGWKEQGELNWGQLAMFLSGALTAIIASLVFVQLAGTTVTGLVSSVAHYAQGQQYFFWVKYYSQYQFVFALFAFITALSLACLPTGPMKQHLLGSAKVGFAFLTLVLVLTGYTSTDFYGTAFGWVFPWCWLCAVGEGPGRVSIVRRLLAMLAAWHILLPYPVSGSQYFFGNFLVITSAIICAVDAVNYVVIQLLKTSNAQSERSVSATGMVASAAMILLIGIGAAELQQRYTKFKPIGLTGTEWIHIAPERAKSYQDLVGAIASADVVFTNTGFNSLYFWTDHKMPAPVLLGHSLSVLRKEDRVNIIRGLVRAANPVVIIGEPLVEQQDTELMDWISDNFVVFETTGSYQLLKPIGILGLPAFE